MLCEYGMKVLNVEWYAFKCTNQGLFTCQLLDYNNCAGMDVYTGSLSECIFFIIIICESVLLFWRVCTWYM